MEDLILYHGSRGGLQGPIAPKSRIRCDFGKGFYMGTDENQAKGLVASDETPYIYELKLKRSEMDRSEILHLEGMEWAFFVLYNRGRLESIKNTSFYRKYEELSRKYDIIVGPIADDNMALVIRDFMNDRITDRALLESIQSINYGTQYVAKTEYACSKIEIISERILTPEESMRYMLNNVNKRQEGLDIAEAMIRKYAGNGNYLTNILKKYEKENNFSR